MCIIFYLGPTENTLKFQKIETQKKNPASLEWKNPSTKIHSSFIWSITTQKNEMPAEYLPPTL